MSLSPVSGGRPVGVTCDEEVTVIGRLTVEYLGQWSFRYKWNWVIWRRGRNGGSRCRFQSLRRRMTAERVTGNLSGRYGVVDRLWGRWCRPLVAFLLLRILFCCFLMLPFIWDLFINLHEVVLIYSLCLVTPKKSCCHIHF